MMSEVEERPRLITGGYGRHRRQWVTVSQNGFPVLSKTDFDGSLLPLLSIDATIMVSKNCPIVSEHVGIIFVTQ